jgi:hypothetical protein
MERLKEKRVLDRETKNKVAFMTFIIQMFTAAYKMSGPDAYRYLKRYGGMDFLDKHWWTLHTEDHFWSVRALYKECYRNGGLR